MRGMLSFPPIFFFATAMLLGNSDVKVKLLIVESCRGEFTKKCRTMSVSAYTGQF